MTCPRIRSPRKGDCCDELRINPLPLLTRGPRRSNALGLPGVDGIHLKVRLEADKVCLLVMIGVRADGTKELVALADGFRESSQSWADLLRSCRRRGMTAPVLAVGDGALGFWKALREVFPDTREQRCWFHVSSNVLAALPKSAHPGAKAALAEIYNAEDRDHALQAVKAFESDYGAKWPKAVAKITEHIDVLLAFYDPDRVLNNTADSTSEAVRWLRRSYRAGALVDAVAALGMAVPRLYGPTLRFDAGFDRHGPEFSYAIRAGAPLMAGWTVLLMWANRRPLERRGVLPITIVPVIAGLVANDTHAVRAGQLFGRGVAPVRALQLALVGLFAYSAVKARAALRVGSE